MPAVFKTYFFLLLAFAGEAAFSHEIFEFEGHTYKIIDSVATWDGASRHANEMTLGPNRGYLAVVNSSRENQAIFEAVLQHVDDLKLADSVPSDGSGVPFVWLGGSDVAREGTWVWASDGSEFWSGDFNGRPLGNSYTNWGVQPDSATGSEDALAMSLADWPAPFYDLGTAGQWNDVAANDTLIYVVEFSGQTDLTANIELPLNETVNSGIGLVSGWAVSSDEVVSVELFIDGEFHSKVPHGGLREDVESVFPEVPNSADAGFASAINFSALSAGGHSIAIRVTDEFGSVVTQEVSFRSTGFSKPFITANDSVNLSNIFSSGIRDFVMLYGIEIAGERYNIALKWTTATQGFEIVSIQPAL